MPDQLLPDQSNATDVAPAHLESARTLAVEIGAPIAKDGDLAASIAAGLASLHDGFRALQTNTDLDTAKMEQAGALIAEAVATVGINDWLVAVRALPVDIYQHCMAVAGVAAGFGTASQMDWDDLVRLTLAALLHDIGKAVVPADILDKPGPLTPEQVATVQRHTVDGYAHLKAHSTLDQPIVEAVRHHHEMLDGSGYPDQLSGSAINAITRIVTICDIYAAVCERRSYKPPRPPHDALVVLAEMADAGKLDATLVRALTAIMAPA